MYHKVRFATVKVALAALVVGSMALLGGCADAAVYGTQIPAPKDKLATSNTPPKAIVLAGGCYWGMQEVFSHVKGVESVTSGYAGGDRAHANYADSSTGRYGDAESVRITYNPNVISYGDLLRIYFSVAHNPTQLNRQGPDVGPQYRSEIFARDSAQAKMARQYIAQLDAAHVYDAPIATKVSVGKSFFPAEGYMQNYALKHPRNLYLLMNDAPKLTALQKRFPQYYDAQPDQDNRLADNQ